MTKSVMLKLVHCIPGLTDTHLTNNKSKKNNHISFQISDLEVNPDLFEYFSAAKVTEFGLINDTDVFKSKKFQLDIFYFLKLRVLSFH